MIDIQKLQEVPRHIQRLVENAEEESGYYHGPSCATGYYSYLDYIDGTLALITIAARFHKKKDMLFAKQIAVHTLTGECYIRDIGFYGMGGYHVNWKPEGFRSHRCTCRYSEPYYHSAVWYEGNFNYYRLGPNMPLNIEFLEQTKYKYCAFNGSAFLPDYLKLYEDFPQMELLSKAGFGRLAASKMILKKAKADKRFIQWLRTNFEDTNRYAIPDVISAYNRGVTVCSIVIMRDIRNTIDKTLLDKYGYDIPTLVKYIDKNKIRLSSYSDYLKACAELKLDMTEPKNAYPHDFQYWHDMRIDQYSAIKDTDLNEKLTKIAQKYLGLEYNRCGFLIRIAKLKNDLLKEGSVLEHCVGRMNYDQRMVEERSLIFFVRLAESPDVPFVTVELGLQGSVRIVQAYGKKDTDPPAEVKAFISEWEAYAKRKLGALKKPLRQRAVV